MTHLLSLGSDCCTTRHIKRIGCEVIRSPFNSSRSVHHVLIELLSTEFKDVFSQEQIGIGCHKTGFQWGHRPFSWLPDEFRESWREYVDSFLSMKKQKVVFVRSLEHTDEIVQQYDELRQCLSDAGFEDFRLYFGVRSLDVVHPNLFPMNRPPDDATRSWIGSIQDWNEFFTYIADRNDELPYGNLGIKIA